MSKKIQMSINNEKVYPNTIPEAVIIETETSITTLADVLIDIDILKNNTTLEYTSEEKNKLSSIEVNANNYIHPNTHLPSVIEQDEYNRFVTDQQINAWTLVADNLGSITDTNLDLSKAYTDTKIDLLLNSAPGVLDTLNEFAIALGNDPNFATTITNVIALKADDATVNSKLFDKYDKIGGQITGQVLTATGQDLGIKFDNNYLTSFDGTNLALIGSADGFRFSDVTSYNSDQFAGLKYSSSEQVIYFGGSSGSKMTDNGDPNTVMIDMTMTNSGVTNVNITELYSESKVDCPTFVGKINDTSKFKVFSNTIENCLEISTGDASNAPILVRQYTDVNFATIARTLTLLDASGNTILPGKITANDAAFSGTPTAPTADIITNNTQIATTAFVKTVINSKSVSLNSLKSSSSHTDTIATVDINIPSYNNASDTLLVFLNGMILTEDDFVLNTNVSITAKDMTNGGFVATVSEPITFNFVVIKASLA